MSQQNKETSSLNTRRPAGGPGGSALHGRGANARTSPAAGLFSTYHFTGSTSFFKGRTANSMEK